MMVTHILFLGMHLYDSHMSVRFKVEIKMCVWQQQNILVQNKISNLCL